jgi:hypothetical protein
MKYVSVCCRSAGGDECITPEMPPTVNMPTSATANFMAVVKRIAPPHIVEIQLKIFTPGRDGDQHRRQREHRVGDRAHAHGEHVVRPHAEAEEADQHRGVHHHRVAEDRLAAERRDDLRHEAEGGQDEDVDLGVPEDPEQVLPEQRVGARGVV